MNIPSDFRWGTPEGSRDFDRLLDMQMPFREKLEWLEETETLSLRLSVKHAERRPVQGQNEASAS